MVGALRHTPHAAVVVNTLRPRVPQSGVYGYGEQLWWLRFRRGISGQNQSKVTVRAQRPDYTKGGLLLSEQTVGAVQITAPGQIIATPLASGSAPGIMQGPAGKHTGTKVSTNDHIAEELIEAIELGIDADDYCAARGAGASHQECLEAHCLKWDLAAYARARQHSATHAEVMEAADHQANPVDYALSREAGITHAEAIEATGIQDGLYVYAASRKAGATHAEIMEVVYHQTELWYYGRARRQGITHA